MKDEQDYTSRTRHKRSLTLNYQKMIVEELLDEVEDCSMEVSLERVLKVGQKFSYIYDYGSSTYINLRVIGEREGIIQGRRNLCSFLLKILRLLFLVSYVGSLQQQLQWDTLPIA